MSRAKRILSEAEHGRYESDDAIALYRHLQPIISRFARNLNSLEDVERWVREFVGRMNPHTLMELDIVALDDDDYDIVAEKLWADISPRMSATQPTPPPSSQSVGPSLTVPSAGALTSQQIQNIARVLLPEVILRPGTTRRELMLQISRDLSFGTPPRYETLGLRGIPGEDDLRNIANQINTLRFPYTGGPPDFDRPDPVLGNLRNGPQELSQVSGDDEEDEEEGSFTPENYELLAARYIDDIGFTTNFTTVQQAVTSVRTTLSRRSDADNQQLFDMGRGLTNTEVEELATAIFNMVRKILEIISGAMRFTYNVSSANIQREITRDIHDNFPHEYVRERISGYVNEIITNCVEHLEAAGRELDGEGTFP